ncbi:hypothetical protein NM688_g637 [Phlebia brevispora]|uniref:Uncharacterized protein n=1 Tax=Phlebia brevispora TaxID=194682 RepID=A0ACC1TE09_9APHY|nr:hypothetical protein NM688_g637 [Phlebia brevispora]
MFSNLFHSSHDGYLELKYEFAPPPPLSTRLRNRFDILLEKYFTWLRKGCDFLPVPLFVIGLFVLDVVWVYFYVHTATDSVPRNFMNLTHTRWEVLELGMIVYGFFPMTFITGLAVYMCFFDVVFGICGCLSFAGGMWLALPVVSIFTLSAALFFLFPLFGPAMVLPIAQKHAWEHRCDAYPMYVILDGKGFNQPQYVKNIAYFYEQGSRDPLFTYQLSNPSDGDIWTFSLREYGTNSSALSQDLNPTLHFIQYNFLDYGLTGNCSTEANRSTSDVCVNGTYDNENPLKLNLNSSVPLISSSNATDASPAFVTLRSHDDLWYDHEDAPS